MKQLFISDVLCPAVRTSLAIAMTKIQMLSLLKYVRQGIKLVQPQCNTSQIL